jgi:hypothetical protein
MDFITLFVVSNSFDRLWTGLAKSYSCLTGFDIITNYELITVALLQKTHDDYFYCELFAPEKLLDLSSPHF